MKLSKIGVRGLFGVFDHEIPLKDNDITIVIGENGIGKTVILEAIGAFFGNNFDYFDDLEFSEFYFHFTNSDIWNIRKKNEGNGKNYLNLTRVEKDGKVKQNKLFYFTEKEELEEIKRLKHIYKWNLDLISKDSLIRDERLLHHIYMDRKRESNSSNIEQIPQTIRLAMDSINIKIIETQRIITAKERNSVEYTNTVEKYSKELVSRITSVAKKASEAAAELDSTYPNRLVEKLRQGTNDSLEELNEALINLGERRKLLSSLGLVETTHDADLLKKSSRENTDILNPLKLYIDDSHKKLAPYDDIAHKIGLFIGIINKRFKHKKLEINRNNGFIFRSTVKRNRDGILEVISATKLSSGEQNELVMFYELIFNSKVGDTILIDEPELSLHISWQNKFIKDLKEVTSMNKVSIIIATHSPDIIDENWDLKVELLGVE
jgi:predicted ATP-binding protein involved in virulence